MQSDKRITLKASEFISVAARLCLEAGNIINEVRESGDLQSKLKGPNDPMTLADIKAQSMIVKCLSFFYPSLRVVGEEEEQYQGTLEYDFSKFNKELVPVDLWPSTDLELDIEDCLVFVDPLDGTLCFTKNQLDCVQTLIGLTYKSKPLLGIVGQHYQNIDSKESASKFSFCPTVYFSNSYFPKVYWIEKSGFTEKGSGQISVLVSEKAGELNKGELIAVTSDSKSDEALDKKLLDIGVKNILRIGGAGNKILCIVKGKADFFYVNKSSLKYWDICAGNALIESTGGKLTDMNGDPYVFKVFENKDEYTCKKGMLLSTDAKFHPNLAKLLLS